MPELKLKNYVNGNEIKELEKNGQVIATIASKGEYVAIVNKKTGTSDEKLQLDLELVCGNRTWTPNTTSIKALAAEFGQNTDAWKGKEIVLYTALQIINGEQKTVVFAKPVRLDVVKKAVN